MKSREHRFIWGIICLWTVVIVTVLTVQFVNSPRAQRSGCILCGGVGVPPVDGPPLSIDIAPPGGQVYNDGAWLHNAGLGGSITVMLWYNSTLDTIFVNHIASQISCFPIPLALNRIDKVNATASVTVEVGTVPLVGGYSPIGYLSSRGWLFSWSIGASFTPACPSGSGGLVTTSDNGVDPYDLGVPAFGSSYLTLHVGLGGSEGSAGDFARHATNGTTYPMSIGIIGDAWVTVYWVMSGWVR